VHEHQRPQFGRRVEERVEIWIAELTVTDPGADLHPEEPKLLHTAAQLGDRRPGILQRHRSEGPEPLRALGHQAGQEVVLRAGQHRSAVGRSVMAEGDRSGGDHLQGYAVGVHVGQPALG
jgi:hypothetical protein